MAEKYLKIFLINILVFLAILFTIEFVIRITNPSIQPTTTEKTFIEDDIYGSTFGLKPNTRARSMGEYYEVGEQRFWKYSSNKDSLNNWLLLGDSVTMGMGVDQDSTFAGKLAQHVDSLNVLNPAFMGYSTKDYINILNHLIHSENKDFSRVTLFWCLNDIYSGDVAENTPTGLNIIGEKTSKFIYDHIFTYQWLKKIIFDRPKTYFEYDLQYYTADNPSYKQALQDLKQIQTVTDSLDIPFEVVILPYEYQLRSKNITPQKLLVSDLDKLQITAIDPYNRFNTYPNSSKNLYLYGDGIHFSNEGHNLIFEVVATHLDQHSNHP